MDSEIEHSLLGVCKELYETYPLGSVGTFIVIMTIIFSGLLYSMTKLIFMFIIFVKQINNRQEPISHQKTSDNVMTKFTDDLSTSKK